MGKPNNSEERSEAADGVARQSEGEAGYRFYALYDKISRDDILAHAYPVPLQPGRTGHGRSDFEDVEAYGVERWLGELALELRKKTYRPDPVRRVFIPKANSAKSPKLRPLGISTLRDRVCMTAAMLVLEPIFEADLQPEQYAYRPDRSALQAVIDVEETLIAASGSRRRRPRRLLRVHSTRRTHEVGCAAHRRSAGAASDQDVAGMRRGGNRRPRTQDTNDREQGHGSRNPARSSRLSATQQPLHAAIYSGMEDFGPIRALRTQIVNYADDFVILCRKNADAAMDAMRRIMRTLKLTINEEKTPLCRAPDESFDFLGYTFGRVTRDGTDGGTQHASVEEEDSAICRRSAS